MTCDTLQDSICAMRQICTDTIIHKFNYDSAAFNFIQKIDDAYIRSFGGLQTSFNMFIAAIGIIFTILAGIGIWNWWKTNKDFSDIQKRILDLETKLTNEIKNQKDEFEKNLNEQIENQKNEFSNMKNEIENKIKELDNENMRDFIRTDFYFSEKFINDDEDTFEIIKIFENKKGKRKSMPYLKEFYRRMETPMYYKNWIKMPKEEKEKRFLEMVEDLDKGLYEKYFD